MFVLISDADTDILAQSRQNFPIVYVDKNSNEGRQCVLVFSLWDGSYAVGRAAPPAILLGGELDLWPNLLALNIARIAEGMGATRLFSRVLYIPPGISETLRPLWIAETASDSYEAANKGSILRGAYFLETLCRVACPCSSQLSKKTHPDTPGGSSEKFHELNEAYSILGDDSKRLVVFP